MGPEISGFKPVVVDQAMVYRPRRDRLVIDLPVAAGRAAYMASFAAAASSTIRWL